MFSEFYFIFHVFPSYDSFEWRGVVWYFHTNVLGLGLGFPQLEPDLGTNVPLADVARQPTKYISIPS
jgi:hypothetical protein